MIHGAVQCTVCGDSISKYGLHNHMRDKHGQISDHRNPKHVLVPKRSTLQSRDRNKRSAEKLSPEMIAEIKKLNEQGLTQIEVAKQLGLDPKVIIAAKKIQGFSLGNYRYDRLRKKFSDEIRVFGESELGKKLVEEYKTFGGTIKGLSKKYGIYSKTLKHLLVTSGVPLKNNTQARREQACTNIGPRHHRYGRKAPTGSGKCHWFLYRGIKYQGSWEFKFGLWLIDQRIEFQCHSEVRQFPYVIDGDEKTYQPDFYIPSWNKFAEIKGYFSDPDRRKMGIVRATYSDVIFEIFDKDRLNSLNILAIDKKLGIDIEKFIIDYKTGETYFDRVMRTENTDRLIDDWILNKKSWGMKAKELGIPVMVFSRVMHTLTPEYGSEEFHDFIIDRYFDREDILRKRKAGISRDRVAGV